MRNLLIKLMSALLIAALALPCVALADEIPGIVAEAEEAATEAATDDTMTEDEGEAPTEAEDAVPEEAVATEVVDDVVAEEAEVEIGDAPAFEAQAEQDLVEMDEAPEIVVEEPDEADKLMAPAANEIAIDAAHFPDDAFRGYVAGFDTDGSGGLSDAERNAVTNMTLSTVTGYDDTRRYFAVNVDAHSLQGIEYFPNLTQLSCGGLSLSSLNLSNNTNLQGLTADSCGLTSLVLGGLPNLGGIDCMNNAGLTALDISGCPGLSNLRIEGTGIASLDISHCPALAAGVVPANFVYLYTTVQYTDASGHIYLCCNLGLSIVGGTPVQFVNVKKSMTVSTTVGSSLFLYRPGITTPVNNAKSSKPKVVSKVKMKFYTTDYCIWTANAKGTAKVTIKDGKKYVVTIKVGASAAPAAPVVAPENAITVTKNMKTSVLVGTYHQIFLNGKTGKGFKSSKKKVAVVDQSGNIAAVGAGKTRITFKVGKKKRTLTLTVVDPTIPTAVYLDQAGTVAAKVGDTVALTVALPEGTTSDIAWKSSNKKVATVSNGVVTFKKKGKVTITATAVRGKRKAKVKFKVSK